MKIGFVSNDFKAHPVTYFLLPLLKNIDRDKCRLFCYSNNPYKDEYTEEVQSMTEYRQIDGMSTEQAIVLIQKDKIDVLIDLSGYTDGNRADIFLRIKNVKKVLYLGYPSYVRYDEYVILDKNVYTKEEYFDMKPIFINGCHLCYEPYFNDKYAPKLISPPCLKKGYITFGSFASRPKINIQTIGMWKNILNAVPESKLVLKNRVFSDRIEAEKFKRVFGGENIEFLPMQKKQYDHYLDFNQIDICLDTFPYNGTTTICDGLWMGVPTVTMCGKTHRANMGALINRTVGIKYVAYDDAGYVDEAVALSRDPIGLKKLRFEMRNRMQKGICNGALFAKRFEEALDVAFKG